MGELAMQNATEDAQIRDLDRMLRQGAPAVVGSGKHRRPLPATVYQALKVVVRKMTSASPAGTVRNRAMSTQVAANLLGVSRPFLIKLLEAGEIPFDKVGSHRRVRAGDLRAYQARRDKRRRQVLEDLVQAELSDGMYFGAATPDGAPAK
jgi:excisionase family DNA binding protein